MTGKLMNGEVNMRGGAREGAGRKKKEDAKRITISIVCSPEEKKLIDELTEKSGLSRSQFIMSAINYFYVTELTNSLK